MKMNTQDLAKLIERLGRLDKKGTFTGVPRGAAHSVYDRILEGGSKSVAALVGMVREVDDGTDWKVRYALHGMAHYLGGADKKEARAEFLKGLSSQIGSDLPKSIQGFVIRQLHVVGDETVLDVLGEALKDEDLYEDASQAIQAIGGGVEKFRAAYPEAKGKARVCFAQALGILRDKESIETLRKDAGGEGQIRLTTIWALATLGDPGAVDLTLAAADGAKGFERIELTNSCILLADTLRKAGHADAATKIFTHLRDTRSSEEEKYIGKLAADSA